MFVTSLALAYARRILGRIGPEGIDAAIKIVYSYLSSRKISDQKPVYEASISSTNNPHPHGSGGVKLSGIFRHNITRCSPHRVVCGKISISKRNAGYHLSRFRRKWNFRPFELNANQRKKLRC